MSADAEGGLRWVCTELKWCHCCVCQTEGGKHPWMRTLLSSQCPAPPHTQLSEAHSEFPSTFLQKHTWVSQSLSRLKVPQVSDKPFWTEVDFGQFKSSNY